MSKKNHSEDSIVREIIFVRHGKAEDRSEDLKDEKRALTELGKKEFYLFLLNSTEFFKQDEETKGKCVLWTSPLKRAKETAKIIDDVLDVKPKEMKFLKTGNFEDFTKEIGKLSKKVTQVIVVGHEPDLGLWAEALTGEQQEFAKGSMAKFKVTSVHPLQGALEAYRAPNTVLPEGILTNPVKTTLIRGLKLVRDAEGTFVVNPAEIETVHQLRVKVRSLRSLLWFCKDFFSTKAYRSLQHDWGQFGRALAGLREIDVLQIAWQEMAEEQNMDADPLLVYLKGVRKREAEKCLAYIVSQAGWVLRQRTMNHIMNMVEDGEVDIVRFTRNLLADQMKIFSDNVNTLDVKEDSLATVHRVRIQAKRLRYVCESLGVYAKPKQLEKYKTYKELQKEIGELCDAVRNQTAMREIVGDRELPVLIEQRKLFVEDQHVLEKELRQQLREDLKK